MKVSNLIDLLKHFPADADLQKVNVNDTTGNSDSEMTVEDWVVATDVKDAQGKPLDKKIVCCIFGDVEKTYER